jgi:hypothetical protein
MVGLFGKRIIWIVLVVFVVLVIFVLYQITLPTLGPDTQSMVPVTTSAVSGVWYGTVIVSEAGIMNSVKIKLINETIISGVISDTSLDKDANDMVVTFRGLEAGTYQLIFNFRGLESEGNIEETISVTFS